MHPHRFVARHLARGRGVAAERQLHVVLGHEAIPSVSEGQRAVGERHPKDRQRRFGRRTREEADRGDERQRRGAHHEAHQPVDRECVEQLGDGGVGAGMRLAAGPLPLPARTRQADHHKQEGRSAWSHLLNLKSER